MHVEGSIASCVAGACVYDCLVGSADCNGDPADGCEATLADAPLNCGACGRVCPASLPHSAGACEAGECAFACGAGWADCNRDLWTGAGDGCEVDLSVSDAHCGVCGDPCPAGCFDGMCPGRGSEYCVYFGADLVDPRDLALAGDGSGFLLVVREHATSELVVLRMDGAGRALAEVDRFAAADIDAFDLAYDGSRYVLLWLDGVTNELVASRYDAAGVRDEGPAALATGEFLYAGVRAHDGLGEVLVGVRDQGFWISAAEPLGSGTTVRPLPSSVDAKFAFLSPVMSGYVAVGTSLDSTASAAWPDGRWRGHWTRFDTVGSELGAPALLDPTLGLLDSHHTTLVAAGSGALFAGVAGYSSTGVPGLHVVAFDSSGQAAMPIEPLATAAAPVAIGDLALGSDAFGAWLAHTSSNEPAVYLRQLDASGAALPWRGTVATRGGFLRSTEVAVSAEGALVLWRWSAASGGPAVTEVQGVFVARSDLSITRPCD